MQIDLDVVSYIGETSVTIRSSRRRITIPKEIVEKLGISDGDRIRWVLFNDGRLSISRVRTDEETSGGILIPVEGK
ncbi:MAG: AbrB/MazE/SpoVT family DNA-binding domain-containing protein [Candidatus Fermentibacteraceae bacterium]|nr:AbrB/MazE/SpoVT family DNA-binding domain-containing protein [Candidatus Fermentibacteraceae bacterium]MBN2608403.1 AbrB/MazE/SpoVT family DNA-binding domain-containing protein [Candidatus Fermentibacteraceae bacterium]